VLGETTAVLVSLAALVTAELCSVALTRLLCRKRLAFACAPSPRVMVRTMTLLIPVPIPTLLERNPLKGAVVHPVFLALNLDVCAR
jgi:hypothetical protein